jgi:hypothetical protein
MMEPMLGDFRQFFTESAVQKAVSDKNDFDALMRKLERAEDLIRVSGSKDSINEVEITTAKSTLIRTPLEGLANYTPHF